MPGRSKLQIFAFSVGVVVIGVAATAWLTLRSPVEEIPEVLAEIEADVSIAELQIDAQGPLDDLRLGDFVGQTVFLLIEGQDSMKSGEGRHLRRALHRWILPDDVRGFSIGDAPIGAKVMKGKIERDFVGPMRDELKLPIYVDFGGRFTEAFSLPQGHLGFVIIDPSGEVVYRHAGDPDSEDIAEIAKLLRAEEPPPGPAAPEFEVGELSKQGCAGKACVLVFLDAKVARSEIPGLEDGFEGDMGEIMAQFKKPSVRLARMLAADWSAEDRSRISGVVVGEGEGWSLDGWEFVAEAPEARELFGIGDEAGLVVIDEQGRLAFAEKGLIPIWKMSLAADVLGIELEDFGGRKKK